MTQNTKYKLQPTCNLSGVSLNTNSVVYNLKVTFKLLWLIIININTIININ